MANIESVTTNRWSLPIVGNDLVKQQIKQIMTDPNNLPVEIVFEVQPGIDRQNPTRKTEIKSAYAANSNYPNCVWLHGDMQSICDKDEQVPVAIHFDLSYQTGTMRFL